ncbi:peptidyl-prolyl cis-trans isomerase FKBP4 [Trichonephila clavipes]|nr:peptidyl-prolyl cis-trans isomerase FKBP4 [Trichonephila clavipes]
MILSPLLCLFGCANWGRVLLKRPICISEMLLGPRKYNFNNVPPLHFLIDFNAHKNQRCFATCANSTPDHDRLWILVISNNCRGAWSVRTPDSTVLGVMNLLNRKELLTMNLLNRKELLTMNLLNRKELLTMNLLNRKELIPALTCGPFQKFSASTELYEFFFQ